MNSAITVVCPNCGNRMVAQPEYVGRKGRCQKCDSLIDIRPADNTASSNSIHPTKSGAAVRLAAGGQNSADAPAWLTGLIAFAATAALYLAVFRPLQHTDLGVLFVQRGKIPYLSTFVTCWGVAILVWKYVATKRQLAFVRRELDLIPLDIGVQITQRNVNNFLRHLAEFSDNNQSILCRRIAGALEHFKSRNSVPEVQQYLATQAEIDASSIDAGYSLLRTFIWANPILGFIGTVVGISFAVSGLSQGFSGDSVPVDGDAGQQLANALGQVTSGLSTAFDTTLIGLVFAMLLMFPTEALRKTEYQTLDRIEQFTNESLLRRMSDADGTHDDGMPEVVRVALDAAFQEHQRWLAQWQAQVSELGRVIGGDFEAALARVETQMQASDQARWQRVEEVRKSLADIFQLAQKSTGDWQRSHDDSLVQSRSLLDVVARLQAALVENVQMCHELLERQSNLSASLVGRPLSTVTAVRDDHIAPVSSEPAPRHATGWDSTIAYQPPVVQERRGLFSRIFGRK